MKAIFVPSMGEAKGIFPNTNFEEWKYGIFKGLFQGTDIFITGVSKTPAAFATTMIMREFEISKALLTGVCGAYRSSGLSVGDVVAVSGEYFADEGLYTENKFQSLFDMGFGFIEKGYIPFEVIEGLPVRLSNTVSFLDGKGVISEILQKETGADVENMEGAAFGYVCNILGVNAFQVRSVSNFCGERSKQEWDFKKAISNLKKFFVSLQF